MNRIYKVIYSKARQCYIVVSELAKSNHKSSQQGADRTNTPALARIIAVALAAGALTWGTCRGSVGQRIPRKEVAMALRLELAAMHQKQKMLLLVREPLFLILMGHQAPLVILWLVMEPISITMPVRAAVLPLVKMQR